ncbi:hypothetical protein C5S32_01330 [ANME-1 cluster archaeon GoMg1]|nr:hypothetical protein [ANME-1 cluster archaeon GoMg1]
MKSKSGGKKRKTKIMDHALPITHYELRITDYALPITRYVAHETQNRLHQTFLQAKTFTKKMLTLFFASKNLY